LKDDNTMSRTKNRPVKTETAWTMSIPAAGRKYYGLGRVASYAAAHDGTIPFIWVGGLMRAVVPAIERKLEEADREKPAA
jgi:hypothetical protein